MVGRGDTPEPMDDLEEHDPLTLYAPARAIGYLAVIPGPGARVAPADWKPAAAWLKAGRLPDGSPLSALSLIVPIRQLAIELLPWARAHGVSAVLYPDRDGQWWNPAPAHA